MNFSNYRYIVIEGSIGAGKTSLAQKLTAEFNATLILEQFEDNSFLPKFYDDPQRYAFSLELSFLASRFQQLKEALLPSIFNTTIIADYMIDKCLIFARNTLQQNEFIIFRKLFKILKANLPSPDLIVYLYKSPELLKKNIIKRGRPYEKNIDVRYLEKIQKSYFQYLKEKKFQRVIIIDADTLDFVNNNYDYELIKKTIISDYSEGIHHIHFSNNNKLNY